MNKEELIKEVQELEKALEEKKSELERVKKQDRFKKYADVKAGETFIYKGHEYTKLRNSKAIINDYDSVFMDCLFDNVNNDYDESLIRHYINSEKFLNFLELYRFDFSATGDYCELLSKEEYEKNKDIIKNYNFAWWLRSGGYLHNSGACFVFASGNVNHDYVVSASASVLLLIFVTI